jgi:hypothetical protein
VKRPIHVGKSVFRTSCLAYQPCATAAMTDDALLPFDRKRFDDPTPPGG